MDEPYFAFDTWFTDSRYPKGVLVFFDKRNDKVIWVHDERGASRKGLFKCNEFYSARQIYAWTGDRWGWTRYHESY